MTKKAPQNVKFCGAFFKNHLRPRASGPGFTTFQLGHKGPPGALRIPLRLRLASTLPEK